MHLGRCGVGVQQLIVFFLFKAAGSLRSTQDPYFGGIPTSTPLNHEFLPLTGANGASFPEKGPNVFH